MIGAIIGDIAGSTYEFHSIKTKDFPLFAPGSNYTDDILIVYEAFQYSALLHIFSIYRSKFVVDEMDMLVA